MTTTTLVAQKSVWRYKDDGSDQGTAWKEPGFDDSGWAAGPAQLGYGEGDEATVLSFGTNPKEKHVTTYFRQTFNVIDRTKFKNLIARMIADDGSVIYLNGVEVDRENLPAGQIKSTTQATKSAVEGLYLIRNLDPTKLVDGSNVIAVEVHQHARDTSDLSFDLTLTGSEDLVMTRAPYLQAGWATGGVVRWRTDLAAGSRVRYGTSLAAMTSIADDATATVEHAVTLTGLTPSTRYYYSVGTVEGAFTGGGTAEFSFVTSPPPGTAQPTRIWVIGDAGLAGPDTARVRDAYASYTGARGTDLWLMLGDNAYNEGTDDQYQRAVFEMYPALLPKVFLWPTIGNHETYNSVTREPEPYLNIFHLPTRGEAGGIASGTEKYYSFDYGNIHFLCLDSMSSPRGQTDPMLTWAEADLAANDKPWVIAFWHHPPYSKGSHDSDAEGELVEMREHAVRVLERHGVDLVLTGHSHNYERSFLLDGHYGDSTTLTPTMIRNAGAGRAGEGGAYSKATRGRGREGAVYVVAGSAAQIAPSAPLDHPAMFVSLNELGSLVLDIDGLQLDAAFVRDTGEVGDRFTLRKGVPPPTTEPPAPTMLTAAPRSASSIQLAWSDQAADESGFELERSPDGMPATFAPLQAFGANAVRHLDGALAPDTTFHYRVRAVNAAGKSPWSNVASARTPRPCEPPDACPPDGGAIAPDAGGAADAGGTGLGGADGGKPPPRPRNRGCTVAVVGAGGPPGDGRGDLWIVILLVASLASIRLPRPPATGRSSRR